MKKIFSISIKLLCQEISGIRVRYSYNNKSNGPTYDARQQITTVITQTHNNQPIQVTITTITRTDKSKGTVTGEARNRKITIKIMSVTAAML